MFPDWSEDFGDREAYDLNPFASHEQTEMMKEAGRISDERALEAAHVESPSIPATRWEDLTLNDMRFLQACGIDFDDTAELPQDEPTL